MEDVSFGHGEVIFVDEFAERAAVGKTFRLIGRLVSYDPVQQIAQVADPDNEALQVSMSTTLLTQVKPFSADDIVALVGEVRVNSSGEMIFQPRVFAHTAPGMNYDLYRLMILNRRKHMREHGFT